MPQPYRGGPDGTSRFVFADGREAIHVPRDKTDYSALQGGYPLAEEFLHYLSEEDIDLLAIDDGEQVYVFERSQYLRGSRVGHAPYPMKRVAPLDAATVGLQTSGEDGTESPEGLVDGDRESRSDRDESWGSNH